MRFHRIRVVNLNSLYDEQIIDLEHGLGGAGLFLIHGPTGSGKSTILDAICLALYGRTPRLDDKTTKNAAEVDGLKASDPKLVMSRGAGASTAEVEFSIASADGGSERWKAAWNIRRARDKSDGNFLAAERSLQRLQPDGEWKLIIRSQKKGEVEEQFNAALQGLSFEDFQRTTMLAQFAFREFLEADEGKRAELLERMTSGGRFREIGRRAFERRREAVERLAVIEATLEGKTLLSADEAQEKRAALATAEAEIAALATQIAEVEAQRAYFVELVSRRAEVEKAHAEVMAVEAARQESGEALAALEADEGVAHARTALATWRESQAAQARADGECARASEVLTAKALALSEAEAKKALAASERARIEAKASELAGPLDVAEAAWRERASASEGVVKAEVEVTRGAQALEMALQEQAKAGANAAEVARDIATVEQQLLAIPAQAQLVEAAAELDSALAELKRGRADLTEKVKALKALGANKETLERALHALDQQSAPLLASFAELEAQVTQARADLDTQTDGEPAERAQALWHEKALSRAVRERELDTFDKAMAEIAAMEATSAQVERERDLSQSRLSAESDAIRQLESRVDHNSQLHKSEAEKVAILEKMLHLVDKRAVLVDGEDCPVCGSTDHPYIRAPSTAPSVDSVRYDKARTEAVVAALSAEIAADTKALKVAAKAEATAHTEVHSKLERLAQLAEDRAEREREVERLEARLEVSRQPHARAAARQHLAEEVRAASARDTRWRESVEAERKASKALTEVRDERARVEALQLEKKSELGELNVQLRAHDASRAELAARVSEREAALSARLAELAIAEPTVDSGVTVLRQRKDTVVALNGALAKATARQRDTEVAVAHWRGAVELRSEEGARGREALAQATTRRDEANRAVAANFEGADPRALRQALTQELKTAVDNDEAAGAVANTSQQAKANAEGTLGPLNHAVSVAVAAVEQAQRGFESACAACGITAGAEEVAARALEEKRRAELRVLREQLHRRQTETRARAEGADEALVVLEARRPANTDPEVDDDARLATLGERRHELTTRRSEVEQAVGALRQELTKNEQAMQEHAQLDAKRNVAKEDAQHWESVSELIGVNEGKAFVSIVQALNLNAVIELANARLSRFMRRYALEQVVDKSGAPRLDFVVVDAFNQGAHRTVKSLSGGESFIVSLALALGLADLRSSRLRIETLLIDEGFGSLDGKTLQEVLDALTALQAASGAQIGLISHVDMMREAIPAQIAVIPVENGRSTLKVLA